MADETFPAIPAEALVPAEPGDDVGHPFAAELTASRASGDPSSLVDALCARLGIDTKYVSPAFRAYAAATLKAARIAGGFHIEGIGPATRTLRKCDELYDGFADELLPGLRIGDNRWDVPLWIGPTADEVLSLHEEETLASTAQRAAGMNRHSRHAAWSVLCKMGSAMTLGTLVRLQLALLHAFGDRLPPVDAEYLAIVLAQLGMRRDVFKRRLDRYPFEVFRLHADDVDRLKAGKKKGKPTAASRGAEVPVWKGPIVRGEGEAPLPALWQLRVPTRVASLCGWRGGVAIALGGDVVSIDERGELRWRLTVDPLNAGTHGIRAAGEVLVTHARPTRGGPEELLVLGDGELRQRVRLDHVIDHERAWVTLEGTAHAIGRTKKNTHRWSRVDLATGKKTSGDLSRGFSSLVPLGDRFLAMSRFGVGLCWLDRDGSAGDTLVPDPVLHLAGDGRWLAVVSGAKPQAPLTLHVFDLADAGAPREVWTMPVAAVGCAARDGRVAHLDGAPDSLRVLVRDIGSREVVYEAPARGEWPLALVGPWLQHAAPDEHQSALVDVERRAEVARIGDLTKVDVIGGRVYLREIGDLVCATVP